MLAIYDVDMEVPEGGVVVHLSEGKFKDNIWRIVSKPSKQDKAEQTVHHVATRFRIRPKARRPTKQMEQHHASPQGRSAPFAESVSRGASAHHAGLARIERRSRRIEPSSTSHRP